MQQQQRSKAGDFGDAPRRPSGHTVQFYEQDAFLVSEVSRFVGAALVAGEAAFMVATETHRRGVEKLLSAHGLNVAIATQQGRYVALDARETLSQLLVDGMPDAQRFTRVIGQPLKHSVRMHRRVSAFGEMVALLWVEGRHDAALALERLWTDLGRAVPLTLLCAYPMAGFAKASDAASLDAVCAEHTRVVPAEGFTALMTDDQRLRVVTHLQQRAAALETELAARARQEAEMRVKVEQLAEIDRRKDEFLAMLGHELRNPLGAVQNALLTASLDSERRERALRLARRQADQLARLVDDLLDVARFTQGKIRLDLERVHLESIVQRAVEATRRMVEARGHRMSVSPIARNVVLQADAARLEQVLVNLISNAAKYTPPGGRIEVETELCAQTSEVVVRVRDNGIGLPPEGLRTVFDMFSQASRSLDRAEGGLGIGLTVVRRIVDLHGGRVEARSAGVDTGAEFAIYLPVTVVDTAPDTAVAPVPPTESGSVRVLLVEDDEDSAETLMMLLELFGHRVRIAHDGSTAVTLAGEMQPDVMLVDLGLPGIDGLEVARRVRRNADLACVELVALTGYADEEHRSRTAQAGFDHHIVKPVDIDRLQDLLAKAAASRRLRA